VTNDSILTTKTKLGVELGALIDQSAGSFNGQRRRLHWTWFHPSLSIYIYLDILCENKQERKKKKVWNDIISAS
jgi:hypothetical protein